MLDMWLSIHGLHKFYLRFKFLDDGFILALGPLIFLYAKTIMYEDYKMGRLSFIHFIPFLLLTLYFLIISFVPTKEEQERLVDDVQSFNLPFIVNLIGTSFYLHSLGYLFITFREVKRYRNMIQEEFSSIKNRNYEWLNFTVKSLGILILLAIIHALVPYSLSSSYGQVSAIFFIAFIFYFANRVVLKGLMQPDLFMGLSGTATKKYTSSNLTTEQRKSYEEKLIQKMLKDRPFLDPDLTINQLAKELNMPSKTLSQVINQSFEKSFFDFVNTYRVEEAQSLFDNSTDDKLTVQEVMYQSGFNSKSSFITFFKKLTGMTPSEYKKQL